jgi:hypothetical protein
MSHNAKLMLIGRIASRICLAKESNPPLTYQQIQALGQTILFLATAPDEFLEMNRAQIEQDADISKYGAELVEEESE